MAENSSPFPDDFFSYSENRFYDFVKDFVGDIEAEIPQIQCIKNIRTLLRVNDVFSFFRMDCKETSDLKQKACFINDDMTYIVRAGIQSNMEHFIESLRRHYPSSVVNECSLSSKIKPAMSEKRTNAESASSTSVFVKKNDQYSCKSLLHIFVDNAVNNMKRSSNNYQYDPLVEKFASALYILAGHNAYEFIRMNLPGSLPSIGALKAFNKNINLSLNESELRFDPLKKYLCSIDSSFIFAASLRDLRMITFVKKFFRLLVEGCHGCHQFSVL